MEIRTLDELLTAIRDGRAELTTDMPTFGGEEPAGGTDGVWSWDADRLLVGTHVGQPGEAGALRIVSRREWAEQHAA